MPFVFWIRNQRIKRPNCSDGDGKVSWWRLGKTGGIVQRIGSAVLPIERKRPGGDESK